MTELARLIAGELDTAVPEQVSEMAAAIAARHGSSARAVLFYGSCLREEKLDGLMLDFYLIVSDYGAAYDRRWLASANRVIPPNVFPFAHDGLAAKYAVLSEADFLRLCGNDADTVSVWARFAQPSRLAWAREPARAGIIAAVGEAAKTFLRLARPMATGDALAVWQRGFELTYAAELRAESNARPGAVVDADPERYVRISAAVPAVHMEQAVAERRWAALRRRGKIMSVLRLAKATMTFAGGIDYLAWKINRHAGTAIAIKPWQRRFPIMGGLSLLPRLLRSGAIR